MITILLGMGRSQELAVLHMLQRDGDVGKGAAMAMIGLETHAKDDVVADLTQGHRR